MQRHWELDELVDHFTLLPQEVQLIREARTAHNRLGFQTIGYSTQQLSAL